MTPFAQAVYDIVRRIKKGQTMTYKEVAIAAGRLRACRGVGNILNRNFDPTIPCHRVIRSDGTTGGYNRGSREKAKRLADEKSVIRT